ncbi:Protein sco1 [Taphrina deformans PYCC 5710]|uniref:Protein sco1 n=1 Tax=Taphrina deformans (strain PYCC 5710 / ATCC 11124 / CBS 356.35 / IMI 108563 / JCM 9778 / NBRC 8474) TaxID=1097556 RepID=R4XHS2_TAPDE|nr:Protein sco1 [Taphrina deformans PYCC 5710]|eukprot:CCG82962.1 Protein sco1 [Taphrina deformans PYCC 5710]
MFRSQTSRALRRGYSLSFNASIIPQSILETPDTVSQTKLAEATLKRFWKSVSIEESSLGYVVTLDKKALKTPSSAVLQIPSNKKTLATLIAAEWSQVSSASIRQHQLPLTSLAARAIDHLDLHHRDRASTITTLLRYLDTDAVLIHIKGSDKFQKMQEEEWTPIRKWAETFFETKISFLPAEAGIISHKQSPETRAAAMKWIETLDKWELAAFERSVYVTKSFLLSTLLVESQKQGLLSNGEKGKGGALGVEEIAQRASLEVRYQTDMWGEVEDTHDVDHEDIRRQLASAVLLISSSQFPKSKIVNPPSSPATQKGTGAKRSYSTATGQRRTFSTACPRLSGIKSPNEVKEKARVGPFSWQSGLLFTVTAVVLGFYFNSERKRVKIEQAVEANKPAGKPRIGGPFSLVDHDNRRVTQDDFKGKYLLLYFGFTRCPDICPEELDKMALVLKDVNAEAEVVKPVFITCDPARDSTADLKKYLAEFDPSILGLTGTYEEIKQVCKAFRVYFSTPREVKEGEDYLVDHSIFFYLMDPEGQFVDAFGRNYTPEQAARRMKEYIGGFKPTEIKK